MQEKHLFEYAVIRVMPRVDREEFMNIGIVLYCAKQNFLRIKYVLNKKKLIAFSPAVNIGELQEHLASFERICAGDLSGGVIAKLDMPSRFRWLTATRSTVLQTSKVHPGLCSSDAAITLDKLYDDYVL